MTHVHHIPAASLPIVAHKLDAIGWGLFFIWVGVALIADLGWGPGLLGVGAITVSVQLARRYFGLEVEGLWVGVGLLLVLGGLWELLGLQASLVPIVLIVAGTLLLLSAVRRGAV
jgi:hypothetical protein